MSEELYWMGLTVFMTGLFWMPYILNRFVEIGIFSAILNPDADPVPKAKWAKRMMCAHSNAIENLMIFVPLSLAVHLSGTETALTALAAMVYFYTRLAHYIVYTFGVPVARTITFLIGFACQTILGLTFLEIL